MDTTNTSLLYWHINPLVLACLSTLDNISFGVDENYRLGREMQ